MIYFLFCKIWKKKKKTKLNLPETVATYYHSHESVETTKLNEMQVLEGGVKWSFSPHQTDSTHIPDLSLAKLQIAAHLEPSE